MEFLGTPSKIDRSLQGYHRAKFHTFCQWCPIWMLSSPTIISTTQMTMILLLPHVYKQKSTSELYDTLFGNVILTEKKSGAILKNGALLEGVAVFFLNNHVWKT